MNIHLQFMEGWSADMVNLSAVTHVALAKPDTAVKTRCSSGTSSAGRTRHSFPGGEEKFQVLAKKIIMINKIQALALPVALGTAFLGVKEI